MRIFMVSVFIMAFLCSSCGAIFKGTRQTVMVQSAPSNSKIEISPTGAEYTTPASISLERKNNYVLTFSKEGYAPVKSEIQRHISGGMLALDIIFTGVLGVLIDWGTGGWWNLKPETVTVSLERMGAHDQNETINITLIPQSTDDDHVSWSINADKPVTVRIESR